MGKNKYLQYERRAAKKAAKELVASFEEHLKPKPRWMPQWLHVRLIKLILISP